MAILKSHRHKLDPFIAVKDVHQSALWYQAVFGCQRAHGGDTLAVMMDGDDVLICLHHWGDDEHPTMMDASLPSGNGLLFYYKTDNMTEILAKVKSMGYPLAEDLHTNPNSQKQEFALRDPDGYYWIISEYNNYEA